MAKQVKKILTLCSFQKATFFDVENQSSNNNGGEALTDHETLYRAAMGSDWETAEPILRNNIDYAFDRITRDGQKLLHVAVSAPRNPKKVNFVGKLIEMLKPVELEHKDDCQLTAFVYAVELGDVELAGLMVTKNDKLPVIVFSYEDYVIPLQLAIQKRNRQMISYLYTITPLEKLGELICNSLMEAAIQNDMYDLALRILSDRKSIASAKLPTHYSFLSVLFRKPPAIIDKNQGKIWRKCLHAIATSMKEKHLVRKKVGEVFREICNVWFSLPDDQLTELITNTEVLHYAAINGNAVFLAMILRKKPALSLVLNKKGHTIFHVAVSHRQESVFNLIYNIGYFKQLILQVVDEDGNNILHLAAILWQPVRHKDVELPCKLGQPEVKVQETEKILPRRLINVSGAALQMQREILWYEELKKIVPSKYCKMTNANGTTPDELFLIEHKSLIKEGEKWMRYTANSCMIVATLIATVVFAAAFTVPGGYDQNSGIPILRKQITFTVFTISDSVAMVCSIMSIMMFLSILTSCYTRHDFRSELPAKLFFGLTALFVSVVGMLVAFTIAFFLVYKKEWEPMLIAVLVGLQLVIFGYLQGKLWFDMIKSTISSKSLFGPSKLMI